jgi:protein-S-isoprenylcysteine O-methyltransferase Ste14
MLTRYLISAMWLAWVGYWMAAAAGAKRDSRRESAASRFAHLLPLGLAILLISVAPLAGWAGARFLPRTWAFYWLGVALVAAGLGFACWARLHIGRNWSAVVTVKQDHELVRSGPYAIVRHPIYSGILLAILGTAVARGDWQGLLAVPLILVAFLRKIRLEEAWMAEQFPGDYPNYRQRVAALVPFLL